MESSIIFFFLLLLLASSSATPERYNTYIVFVSPPAKAEAMSRTEHRHLHLAFLPSLLTASGETRFICSYTEIFYGFAALLTEAELAEVAKMPGFLRALPDGVQHLHTTRTPSFLGLSRERHGLWSDARYGRGVVIGVLDSGIYARHSSFRDDGMPRPPARWNGSCTGSLTGHCNRKLVGAKSFVDYYDDPEDDERVGHGTHVAGIAAGNFVQGASLAGGLGSGTAAGIAPRAHLAVYKVCTAYGRCPDVAITCGMEEAVRDGVDVINLSLGTMVNLSFGMSPSVVGAFNAMAKGVVVVSGAGNQGPARYTVTNDAPWMITVGAGSVDRHLEAEVEYEPTFLAGETLVQDTGLEGLYPVLYRDYCNDTRSSDVADKMVVCKAVQSEWAQASIIRRLQLSGAAGVLLIDDESHGYTTILTNFEEYNVVQINGFDGRDLISYAKTMKPLATVSFNGAVQGIKHSPTVAFFSSRGPSQRSRGLLKPDVLAPGLNIISASSSRVATTEGWSPLFNTMSGTSMATPHIAGVAALLKSVHPDWSPAAIKSAIMTTADPTDNDGRPILDELHDDAPHFAMGTGHVNPSRATDPGLVYDISTSEYAAYICTNFGEIMLRNISSNSSLTCSSLDIMREAWLNLPTIMVPLTNRTIMVPRTLTNVGPAATYEATVQGPTWLDIRVSPDTLVFSRPGERKSVIVSVTVNGGAHTRTEIDDFLEGSLIWVSRSHLVRSPVVAVKGLPDHGL